MPCWLTRCRIKSIQVLWDADRQSEQRALAFIFPAPVKALE